jgi:pimeloyl-ACP methyl ester carboxylesterase
MANELSALVEVGGGAVDRLVIGTAESLHRAVAGRVFRSVGPLSAPSRFVHDAVARAAYATVRLANGAATSASASSVRLLTGADSRPLSASRRGRATIAALNALMGDLLDEQRSPLAIQMAIRRKGADVACEAKSVRRAFPRPTARLAVFLHGLGETEERWQRGAARHRGRARLTFGEQLRRDCSITPIEVRYNSGLHISSNGRRLSDLLEDLLDAWPVKVEELILVGHSMGGLVARSACHAGSVTQRRWPSSLGHLIALGSPHTGVPLEKSVHAAAWALRAVPETQAIARILDMRSEGIRDLRFGYLVEDDWRGEDPDRLMHDNRSDVPPLPGCTQTFITATLTRDPWHPLGWLGGDFLVRTESAAGRRPGGGVAVPADEVIHVGSMSHFDLLDHPRVYKQIHRVLMRRSRPGG